MDHGMDLRWPLVFKAWPGHDFGGAGIVSEASVNPGPTFVCGPQKVLLEYSQVTAGDFRWIYSVLKNRSYK